MKKLLRVAVLAVIASLSTVTANAEVLGFGLMGGWNNAKYSIKDDKGAISNDSGFQVGASVSASVLFLSITPELIYSQNNFTVSDMSILNQPFDVKSKSLDVPVIVGLTLLGPIRVEAGPSFSVMSKATATAGGDSTEIGRVNSKTGYVLGVSVKIFKFTVGARFNGQFGGTNNTFSSQKGDSYDIRKFSYSARIGYKF